jgi:hypothetical protein
MTEYLKVKDHKELVRDPRNKAILNKDAGSLNKYKEERDFRLKLHNIVMEHDHIKSDIEDIKSMLTTLLGRT